VTGTRPGLGSELGKFGTHQCDPVSIITSASKVHTEVAGTYLE
jgi:hypothetical protein